MRRLMLLGIVLIILGAVGIVVRTFDYTEDSTEIGPVRIEDRETTELPLYLGIASLALGTVFVGAGVLRRR